MRHRLYKDNSYNNKIIDESNNKTQKKVNNGTIRTRW
jgi:hypothetical protein